MYQRTDGTEEVFIIEESEEEVDISFNNTNAGISALGRSANIESLLSPQNQSNTVKSVIDEMKSKGGVTDNFKNESENEKFDEYESEEDEKDINVVSAMQKVDAKNLNLRESGREYDTTSEEVIIIEEDEEEEDS